MKNILSLLSRFANFVLATMLAVIFGAFLLQVISRYVFNNPIGWTLELINTLWLWLVFFGAAFVVRERDQVKFDMIYLSSSRRTRIAFGLISAVAIIFAMLYSLPETWNWVTWLSRRDSALLKIPMNWVMFVYIIFMVGAILRYGVQFFKIMKNGPADDEHDILADTNP